MPKVKKSFQSASDKLEKNKVLSGLEPKTLVWKSNGITSRSSGKEAGICKYSTIKQVKNVYEKLFTEKNRIPDYKTPVLASVKL